jgi:pimeloyl-ACP methyl ester carboxylesterase/RimJ/RimL family protein N-acetyltransferase
MVASVAEALRTEHLRLKPWGDEHAGLLFELASMPAVVRYIGDGARWSETRARDVAVACREHWRHHGFGWRAAYTARGEQPIGFFMLSFAGDGAGIDPGEYEIGWWLHPSVWGRGLAREGAAALRDEAFNRVGAPSIVARVQPANRASLSVAGAIGLTHESETTGRMGERAAVLRLTADHWRALTARSSSPNERQPPPAAVAIDGRRIEVAELAGDPALKPIVLLHEGLGSVGLWRDFPAALGAATGRRVIAFSRFGHGRSGRSPWPQDVTGFHHREALTLLPELLAALDLSEPLLVGHSDGASIALIHAGRHPVSGLALLAPHVFVEELTVASIRQARITYLSGGLRDRMARHHDDPDAAFWGWCDIWLHPEFRSWNLEPDADLVTAPTLLIQSANDPYGTLEQLDRIERHVTGPVHRLVVRGGHSPHLEAPATVVNAVAQFAAGLS